VKVSKELLKGSTVILVLSLLEREPMYGYQMIKEMEKQSNGVFVLKEGTLYPILHALEANGMIVSYWWGNEGTRQRKYYRIINKGKQYLKEKRKEWETFRSAVDKVLTGEVCTCS
jgi:PadR family transcriptional regulator PadR